ncbi:MAG: iron ABC transporter permease [Rhodoferax sp.]
MQSPLGTRLRQALFVLLSAAFMAPLLAVMASWLPLGAHSDSASAVLRGLWQTVLPDYLATTVLLCGLVGLGVVVVGLATALAVTVFDFPGRRVLAWALLLPLAIPAYVVAYAYTDFLQFAGPLQTSVRSLTGLQGRVFPEVRSLGGAAWVFVFSLYPYVYLLARTALLERASSLMEAARLLGATLRRRLWQVAVPLCRPAVAAGAALALMETLADYGVSSYFGIQTFTAGIYKAWLAMDDRLAAAQLATVLLGLVAVLLVLEQASRRRLRFALARPSRGDAPQTQPQRLRGRAAMLAWCVCALPVAFGFVLPVLFMLHPLVQDWALVSWSAFVQWTFNSLRLGMISAVLAVALAWWLTFSLRRWPDGATRLAARLVGLGYAMPGAVVVVGLLLPLAWVQARWPSLGWGALLSTTALGLVWAYLVRFSAVALQSLGSGFARIPASFDASALLLGCGNWGLLRRVLWPLQRRTTAVAALLVFVDVMKELPATLVLRPFDSDTLAVVAYQLARDERLGEAALPCLLLVGVGLIPVLLLSRTLAVPTVPRGPSAAGARLSAK